MVEPQQVYDFCNQLKANIGAGFTQRPMHRGFKIIGEYYTYSGQLLSIAITVYKNKVETRIYDSARRCIFTTSTTSDINRDTKLIGFIQRSVTSY